MMSRVAGWVRPVLRLAVAAMLLAAAERGRCDDQAGIHAAPVAEAVAGLDLSSAPESAFQLNNDATLRRWLKEGRARLEAGQINEGLTLWQRILDRGDDGFVRLRADGPWLEVRFEVQRGLSELSPASRAVYERLFGTLARQLFEQSRLSGRPVFATETIRRYFHTAAGFDAAQWLARQWLDKGEARVAARLFDRLLEEPAHRERMTSQLLLQAVAAQQLAGNERRAKELAAKLGDQNFRGREEGHFAASFLDQVAKSRPDLSSKHQASQAREWLTAGGNFSRNLARSGSTPWLKPLWTPASLVVRSTDRSAIHSWLAHQEDRSEEELTVAAEPIVVRGQVVVRELNGIVSFDLKTGRRVWTFPSSLPFSEWLPRAMAQLGESNRAGAVREILIANSACGTFSSDCRRVFAIDVVPAEGKVIRDADDDSGKRDLDVMTQLVALPIEGTDGDSSAHQAPKTVRPIWTLDGLAAASKLGHRGCGVQFLGPPAVVDDCLFLMGELFSFDEISAEKNNQLCLIAVDSSNGEPLWSQGLALVDEPFFRPRQRSRRNPVGSPALADGMLICPTDVGLFVGVDLVTGRQRWVHGYRIGEAGQRREFFPESIGWDGTPTWPVIHRDRVLLLSRFSEELHCLQATTGKLLWRLPRGDSIYIGTVTDDRIILVGEHEVRAIPTPADGTITSGGGSGPQPQEVSSKGELVEPLWTQTVGPVTGRGVRVGDDFLVPLKSGRVACLDLATGRDRGFAVTRTFDPVAFRKRTATSDDDTEIEDEELAPWPGNLIASDDVIVSLGPTRLAVYPQARSVLSSLRDRPESVERRLLESELTMLLGSDGSPVKELQEVLRQPLSPELKRQAERQLRESLYLELSRNPDEADDLLPQLERLADTTAERARLLQRICEVSLPRDPARTVRAARDLAALSFNHELELDEHSLHVVSLDTWARGFLRQVRARVENSPDEADRVDALLNQERDQLLKSSDLKALRQFTRLCDDWPQANDVRLRLAQLLIDRGEFQEAELLLARGRLSSDPRIAGTATVRMLEFWDHVGLYALAARLLSELEDRFSDVEVTTRNGQALTGAEFVKTFRRDSMTWQAFARRQRPGWEVRRVAIREDRERASELRLVEAFGNGDIRNGPLVRSGVGVHLFQTQPLFRPLSDAGWQVVDRDSGVVMGQLPELDRYYPTGLQAGPPAALTHFFPVGGPGRMLGFSLLARDQSESAWETPFQPLRTTQEFLRVGPVGPGFCVYQSRQHLIVVDPATGRIAWRRELEAHSGLLGESETGLFGDREALVVFASDQAAFTVYETATGRELRQGRFPVDQHQSRRAFGRKLFHVTDANNTRHLRIWDPLTGRNELDEPLVGGVTPVVTADGELLLVLRSGRVRVIDVHNGLVKLDVTLPEADVRGVNTLRAFSDRDHYYLNLQRVLDNSNRYPFSYFLNETLVPKAEVLGELYAFARPRAPASLNGASEGLGAKIWMRVMPQRTILRLDNARLPFLIALARQQDRTRPDKTALRVEAIDAESGDLLGSCDHVLTTRLVQTQHDPVAARVTLVGLSTRITLDYGREKQRLARTDEPW